MCVFSKWRNMWMSLINMEMCVLTTHSCRERLHVHLPPSWPCRCAPWLAHSHIQNKNHPDNQNQFPRVAWHQLWRIQSHHKDHIKTMRGKTHRTQKTFKPSTTFGTLMKTNIKITEIEFGDPSDFEHTLTGIRINMWESIVIRINCGMQAHRLRRTSTVNVSLLDSLVSINMTQFAIHAFIVFKENLRLSKPKPDGISISCGMAQHHPVNLKELLRTWNLQWQCCSPQNC